MKIPERYKLIDKIREKNWPDDIREISELQRKAVQIFGSIKGCFHWQYFFPRYFYRVIKPFINNKDKIVEPPAHWIMTQAGMRLLGENPVFCPEWVLPFCDDKIIFEWRALCDDWENRCNPSISDVISQYAADITAIA